MRLSMRALQEKPEGYVEPAKRERAPRREGERGPRREGDRKEGRGPRRDGDRRRDDRHSDKPRHDGPRKPRFQDDEPKNNEPDVF